MSPAHDSAPARVLVMTNALHIGGAEKHAVQLLNGFDRTRIAPAALWLKDDTALLPQLDTARLQGAACLNIRRKLDWKGVAELARLLEAHDVDVVMCANEYPALYAWLASGRLRRPPKLVEIFHTTEYARLKERVQMLLYRRVFRAFDLLVYVSEHQRLYWQQHGLRARADLSIHNGIDCARFTDDYTPEQKLQARAAFGLRPEDYVIALCAALRPEKAHGDLLEALARLRSALPHVRGLIIGDGPERARIEARIERLGLKDAVRITGFQSDVRPLLAASDVAVLTSHAVETFSIAALEALSLGKPMVLTRIGGAAEQIQPGENGFLYEAGDIGALTGHLSALAAPDLRRQLGACAALRVRERFDAARMMQQYTEQLLRLTRERRAMPTEA